MLRLILDLVPIFTDEGVNAMAASATIAAWIVYIAVILGEPFCDTVILVNGGESYLFKGKCYLSPTGIVDLGKDIASLATENETVKNWKLITKKNESTGGRRNIYREGWQIQSRLSNTYAAILAALCRS